jgi:hypothetical protein
VTCELSVFFGTVTPCSLVFYLLTNVWPPSLKYVVRFEVITEKGVKRSVFWDVVPCSIANTDGRF